MPILKQLEGLKTETWLLSGEEMQSHQKLTVCYTGLEQNRRYFAGLVFGKNYSGQYLWPGKFWPPANMVDTENSDYSMVVIEGLKPFGKLFSLRGYTYIPGWVGGGVFLPDDLTQLFKNRSIASDLSRIRRHNLTCEFTHDIKGLERFYLEMYQPLMQSRFGKTAFIPAFKNIQRAFSNCVLLTISKDGEPVSGGILSSGRKGGFLRFIGIKNGDVGYIHCGAMAAVYYYTVKYLHDRGCRYLNLGFTRPFLDDGALCYKRKWGYTITKEFRSGFFLKISRTSAGVSEFLRRKPFIIRDRGQEYAVMFSDSIGDCKNTLRGIESNAWPKAVDGIILCSLEEDGSIRQVQKQKLEGNDRNSLCAKPAIDQ